MTARAVLNATYSHLTHDLTAEAREQIDETLTDPRQAALDARRARIAHATDLT